jgi:hypothetical protein
MRTSRDKNFFILGYPRSRTAWFANLFTTGDIFCYHEMLFFLSEDRWPLLLNSDRYRKVGVSEPTPFMHSKIAERYPDSPKVFIRRSRAESLGSMCKAFNVSAEDLDSFYKASANAEYGIDKDSTVLKVDYQDIDSPNVIENIWRHCIGSSPDMNRIEMLKVFNIQIDIPLAKQRAVAIQEDRLWV